MIQPPYVGSRRSLGAAVVPPFPCVDQVPIGWLPVGFDVESSSVRWMLVGDADFPYAMFDQSISALRANLPPPRELETDLSILTETVTANARSPSGVIVHMSRCGSTLLLTGLGCARGVLAVGEANMIDEALTRMAFRSQYWAAMCLKIARRTVELLASYRGEAEGRLVIKCGLSGMADLQQIRAAWPTVPCLVLIRDPIEVLVSNLQRPPLWMTRWRRDPGSYSFGIPPQPVLAGGDEESFAWLIGRLCIQAFGALDKECFVLDYADLCPTAVSRVASIFDLSFSNEGMTRMTDTFRFHGRYPNRPYRADGETKRNAATEVIRAAVERWAQEPYEYLAQRACQDARRLKSIRKSIEAGIA